MNPAPEEAVPVTGSRVLVTGGAGFIGSTLVGRLVPANEIVVLDDLSRDALSTKEFRDHRNLSLRRGSVLDSRVLNEAMQGADYVIHCAAIAGIDTVIKRPVETMRVNMLGAAAVLDAARRQGQCKSVVCFSTSEVFGPQSFRSSEADSSVVGTVGEARWTYAVSKLAAEHLAVAYYKQYGLPTTVIRPFNVYGPGQIGEGALKTFVQRAIKDEPIQIHGDGTQIRTWCYVDDLIDAILLMMNHPAAVGESFNIGNQRAVITIYGLANTVVRVLESSSPIGFARKDYVDVELRVPSVVKAREMLGFEAKVDLEDGIRRTADHYRQAIHGQG